MLVFITGGVRSGKSAFAERLASSFLTSDRNKLIYVATSKIYDSEMKMRIEKHQEDRGRSGLEWETWEQSTQLEHILPNFREHHVVLVDCLTTLVANELFFEIDMWNDPEYRQKIFKRISSFLTEVKKNNVTILLVSNELLNGGTSYDAATLSYMKLIGLLHQKIVEIANAVYLVEAGIPLRLKGRDENERNYASRYKL
ncbi:bifunctional adenosylcobinamide kinase/adenosylcobinamide-phosphate guanylyltransferase [Anaerobacillus isosaccharinicus]|uniref:Adenosylcobinamide kinase n=1 Tax=Anaerobacillus isosaccharinicus TaxID=1532552 RepID=A0A1S2M424_9BACI|nr:bifunctional adenosylcobinamide kinase/adenosylcobinamide-phosphate guanylyltransferase [Anaerobacillus isosaccharinicus]MBA5585789.1 bifunctional adenosylcobinamide kinase/adenosylcobinamide-phosphate guanylyltransferase [Anaerobacillus isosaccharinicus]QOY35913.1 bifunctional adenosylcobinamide kinase/adenosylcobinamide-phosphate guanylyltransferase [Anaerobacillus isosaccharinicus]